VQYFQHAFESSHQGFNFPLVGKIVACVLAKTQSGVPIEQSRCEYVWEEAGWDYENEAQEEITTSHGLLVAALEAGGCCSDDVTIEFYGSVVKALLCYGSDVTVQSPLLAACQWLNKMPRGDDKEHAATVMQQKIGRALVEQGHPAPAPDGDLMATLREMRLLGVPALAAAGLFPMVKDCVHSCVPNCELTFDGPDSAPGSALHASLYALCSIQQGDPLTVSRIDNSLPLEERRSLLSFYGVNCTCAKCVFQDPTEILSRETMWALGNAANEEQRHEDAEALFSCIVRENPSDGDAHLALGRTHHHLEAWLAGDAAFQKGLQLCPGHRGLTQVCTERERYYMWTPGPVSRPDGPDSRPDVLRLSTQSWCATADHCIHLAHNMFSAEECGRIVAATEAWAHREGWRTKRHADVPTTDAPVHEMPEVLSWFNSALANRLLPLLAARFPRAVMEKTRVHDAFVVKYDSNKQRDLPKHRDQSNWSFTIALNSLKEYNGGGTWFEDIDVTVRPDVGGVVAFPGCLVHAGSAITSGQRYIIAAFLTTS
jgi:predicted 2-oxoglutarate/Fe(II)-dependent dioxygenase YbiX